MRRRDLLPATLPVLALMPARAAEEARNKTTITGLETFRFEVQKGTYLLVRVTTSAGVTGLGDASHGSNDGETARQLRELGERLRGRPAASIEWLRRESGAARVAFSAIEQALWDILGKLAGLPVAHLLGGPLRESVRLYANINRTTRPRTPQGFARMAERAIEAGFGAVKLAPFDELPAGQAAGVPAVAAVRSAIGGADLLVDVHERFRGAGAREIAQELAPQRLFWLEETSPSTDDLAAVRALKLFPTAGGEKRFGVKEFLPYIQAGAVDIVMPDVKMGGGLLEMKKIAGLAEAAGLSVSPHGPASPVGDIAAAHVSATLPNFLILEHVFGEVPWRAELVDPPQEIRGGQLQVSSRPGFGIELNEKAARRYGTKAG